MGYLVYCRDRPGAEKLHEELCEEHWSFMDAYAEVMIARGPTFTDDEAETITGSLHILDLPGPEEAKAFAFEEPNHRAGVYGEVLIRRWSNALGRTMWDYRGNGGRRYLVIGHGRDGAVRPAGPADDRLIAYGPLLSDDGSAWKGTAALVERPDRAAAAAVLGDGPYESVEVHAWQPGGRPTDQAG